ncbi:hypothetical protein B0T16DRAFT_432214 [Cercophora newfieldiana]|uniref:RING-CH-type domain-containing protein n=1 Tax=Cercophora newfieldiana TaxID=92897 RepID=A0AA39XUH6_9PEZI|nr:hypothetical protein B0T16DRAFT_432214 [Cercophora newfieldiana]
MSTSFSHGQWEWPADAASSSANPRPTPTTDAPDGSKGPDAQPASGRKRHYKPRTCRICLEVVQPTTEIDDSIASGLFSSKANVRYVSEDPELGRLISPCLCKGSQRYVHEGCLQAWRQASPLSDRNFWRCPTCQFEYRLSRLKYGRWLSSKLLRAFMTLLIFFIAVFLLGFVADPIINLWVDPLGSITDTLSDVINDIEAMEPIVDDAEPDTWWFHFVKGLFSLGLLGFLKTFFAMSPWHWFQVRGVGRRRGTGRDRMESINLALVIVGVFTFLGATWKLVSHLSAKALEKASDRVVDIGEDTPDDDDEEDDPSGTATESRKDR